MTSIFPYTKNIDFLHFNFSKLFGCVCNRTQVTKTLVTQLYSTILVYPGLHYAHKINFACRKKKF